MELTKKDRLLELFAMFAVDGSNRFSEAEMKQFLKDNKYVLRLSGELLNHDLTHNWTLNKARKMCSMILILLQKESFISSDKIVDEMEDTIVALEKRGFFNEDDDRKWLGNRMETNFKLDIIYDSIFKNNSFEEIYNKFIIPKAMIESDVNYGYSDEQKKYYADLTISAEEIMNKIESLAQTIEFDWDTSLEETRLKRKNSLEIVFAGMFKIPFFREHPLLMQEAMKSTKAQLKLEREKGTDAEHGSLHNVLYGYVSGTNDYCLPYYTYTSPNFYLNFVQTLVKTLNDLIK